MFKKEDAAKGSGFPSDLLRERCKKKLKKKLTNVSFAFTHTYTPVKTNIFRFFPQAYMENFEKCAKTKKQYVVPCYLWLLVFPPLFLGTFPIWFKTSTLKENCLPNYCWGKKEEEKNLTFHHFRLHIHTSN